MIASTPITTRRSTTRTSGSGVEGSGFDGVVEHPEFDSIQSPSNPKSD